ncbi:hypothetical protein [Nisaea sp.]|uniref:hypothetical protein n=1 Tax=Nisaea sp. TaxID=2024842 RepID=UPI0032978834
MHRVETEAAAPECPSGHRQAAAADIEVTAEMIWAALEEWSDFDEVRNELGLLFARVYRAMDSARHNSGINSATITSAELNPARGKALF